MMVLWGIIMVGLLSGRERIKGLLAGLLGLSIAMIGMDPQLGVPRYTFGQIYLLQGLPLIPVLMGLFALPEVIDLSARGRVAGIILEIGGEFWGGIRDAFNRWILVFRSSGLGVIIGAIPGLGSVAAAFYAYGQAVQTSKEKDTFGKGNVDGVIAPESANNAVIGGELIPTLAFGVPGSPLMAVLLMAFLILGIMPGKSMLTEHLELTFSLIWALLLANLVATGICLASTRLVARIATVQAASLIPFVLLFVIWGSYMTQSTPSDLLTAYAFGILGYVMMRFQWPRVPLLVGFVLGGLAENYLYTSWAAYGASFLLRPITMILLSLVLFTIAFIWWSSRGERIRR